MTKDAKLHKILDRAIEAVDSLVEEKRREPPSVPISPLHFSQKLGFKPVVTCDCGSVLDTNVVISHQKKAAWTSVHQNCEPIQEAGELDA